jgi:hypothetical protein
VTVHTSQRSCRCTRNLTSSRARLQPELATSPISTHWLRANDGLDSPPELCGSPAWLRQHSLPVTALAYPAAAHAVVHRLTLTLDGTPAAGGHVASAAPGAQCSSRVRHRVWPVGGQAAAQGQGLLYLSRHVVHCRSHHGFFPAEPQVRPSGPPTPLDPQSRSRKTRRLKEVLSRHGIWAASF